MGWWMRYGTGGVADDAGELLRCAKAAEPERGDVLPGDVPQLLLLQMTPDTFTYFLKLAIHVLSARAMISRASAILSFGPSIL